MKLNKTWKIVIGLATLWVIAYPIVLAAFIFTMVGGVVFAAGTSTEPTANSMIPLLSFFSVFFPLIFLSSFVQVALSGFYLVHIILNKSAADVIRIVFGIGIFYMPIIALPFYYFVFIWPDRAPSWALQIEKPAA